jgi:thioredoxin 1
MEMKKLFISIILIFIVLQISEVLETKKETKKAKVTFIELGSVRCIPCQKMEAVLDSIRKKYPQDVKVIFYDVWTKAGKPYGKKYGVKSIPTQVFLDENGKEYFRHIGYFAEKEVVKILKKKGVER